MHTCINICNIFYCHALIEIDISQHITYSALILSKMLVSCQLKLHIYGVQFCCNVCTSFSDIIDQCLQTCLKVVEIDIVGVSHIF